ncbi:hypothetical protein ESY86_10625 [Subsaximicrobium wynnwilliamsii]|uniref:DUF4352 domain-containing protein n=1 Tax=Subsaximicrobium wynnwilliamsii TaxID=291179 RepID=A0A5C6ZGS4_9FLAO|nr:hypothetical protein [Subsaximicrobium wynnwilliamsii]TXD84101.1 hypothetical protein ESY87_06215 [Subsaximicrobium wynnwilliamsii]TXD88941.1 hypothetical protein ESY86_10625 [Subsaximicrobium wynnwilliamsii]TXE03813.1 hypothetical protein ESY88_06210 [Subsaximicrobium wynnwilliamsii]
MVPVKEAINSGSWLHCECNDYDRLIKFRLKISSFRKLVLTEIDNPDKIGTIDEGAMLWLMQIEFINLTKDPIHPRYGPPYLLLIDQDGFRFHIFEDGHLESGSQFSKTSGMHRFGYTELIPKIKAVGSIVFQLPDDADAEYSISIKNNGVVQEI